MPEILSAEEATRILSFLGYGRLSAPIWFIGLEEGLSKQGSLDQAHNLKARGTWDEVMDLERAHLLLLEGGEPMRISVKPPQTPTWRWMAKISLALAGNLDWDHRRAANKAAEEYVRRRLGRANPELGQTFLTELSPIPSKKVATNKEWLSWFSRCTSDCDQLIRNRSASLSAIIQREPPQFVFCYGSEKPENNAKFKKMFPKRSWQRIRYQSELSDSEGTLAILMPFFGTGRLSHIECQTVVTEILKRRGPAATRA